MNATATVIESSDVSLEDRVRALAYQLWEEAGRPEGCADEHWFQACEIIALQDEPMVDPGWLQRNAAAKVEAPQPLDEKSQLAKSIEEIKRRINGRAA